MQEFLLRWRARPVDRATFELPTKPACPSALRSMSASATLTTESSAIEEAWNTFGDIGAADAVHASKVG